MRKVKTRPWPIEEAFFQPKAPSFSRYKPHQGDKEKARRQGQMKATHVKLYPGDAHEAGLLEEFGDVWEIQNVRDYGEGYVYYQLYNKGQTINPPAKPYAITNGGWQLKIVPLTTHFGVAVG